MDDIYVSHQDEKDVFEGQVGTATEPTILYNTTLMIAKIYLLMCAKAQIIIIN